MNNQFRNKKRNQTGNIDQQRMGSMNFVKEFCDILCGLKLKEESK